MADELEKRASKGGRARAAALSPEERKKIAVEAAEARWGKLPVAEHSGVLRIGELELPCSVLEGGKRVLSETGFSRALGRARSGSPWLPGADPGARMPHFAPPKRLISFLDADLAKELLEPIKYRSTIGGKVGYGVDAQLIPGICEAWLKAREAGALNAQQLKTAERAEILVRGLARVGIIALVDEATGFQAFRDQQELAKFLEHWVKKELRKWVRTFPREFFQQLCRLKGTPFPEDMRLPQYFGKIINDLVYDRLAPGVLDELNKVNPVLESGRRRHKHFQYLTEDVGHPKLLQHLGTLIGLAHGFEDGEYDRFYERVDRVLPNHHSLPLWLQANDLPRRRLPAAKTSGMRA
jgi:hypothetical protein